MRRFMWGLVVLALLIAPAGCGTLIKGAGEDYVTGAYKALKSARIIYDDGMAAAAEAWRLGLIGDADKDRIIEAGEAFRTAWQGAANALYAYAIADAASADMDGLERELALFEAAYAEFSRLARPYLIQALTR